MTMRFNNCVYAYGIVMTFSMTSAMILSYIIIWWKILNDHSWIPQNRENNRMKNKLLGVHFIFFYPLSAHTPPYSPPPSPNPRSTKNQ